MDNSIADARTADVAVEMATMPRFPLESALDSIFSISLALTDMLTTPNRGRHIHRDNSDQGGPLPCYSLVHYTLGPCSPHTRG